MLLLVYIYDIYHIILDFTDNVGVNYVKHPNTVCPNRKSSRNSIAGIKAVCNNNRNCYAYVDNGNGSGDYCVGITRYEPPTNIETSLNTTLYIKA